MSSTLTAGQRRAALERTWVELEWRKCASGASGFIYFCQNYVWIAGKADNAGRVKFELFDYQEGVARDFFTELFLVVLKARQLGLTTLAMAYALWLCMFKPGGATVLVVSKNQEDSNANVRMVRHMYTFLPDWMKDRGPRLENNGAQMWSWVHADGSVASISAQSATAGSGASRTADLIIADEMALWATPSETYQALAPAADIAAASANGCVLMCISTARGAKNYFAQLFMGARAKRNRYKAVFFPWWTSRFNNPNAGTGLPPDRSIYESKRAEFANEPWKLAMEYPESIEDAFQSSGISRFGALPDLDDCPPFPHRGRLLADGDNIRFVYDPSGNVHLACDPTNTLPPWRDRQVVVGADSSLGVGEDSSVAYAMTAAKDGTTELWGYIADAGLEPVAFGDALYDLGLYFTNAFGKPAVVAPENQPNGGGGGTTVVARLRERGYPSVYRFRQPAVRGGKLLDQYGFPITAKTRPLIINVLADKLQRDELDGTWSLTNIPEVLRDELGAFVVNKNGRVEADAGAHDDHVMAVAIGNYVLTQRRDPTVGAPSEHVVSDDGVYTMRVDLESVRRKAAEDAERRARKDMRRGARRTRTTRRTARR